MIVFSVVHRRLRLGPAPKLYSIAECLELLRFTVPRARGFCQAMRCDASVAMHAPASIHIHSFYGFVCLICLPSFSNVSGIHIGPLPVSGLVHFWLFWPQSERQTDGRTDEHPSPSVKPRGLWKWCFESSISMFLLFFCRCRARWCQCVEDEAEAFVVVMMMMMLMVLVVVLTAPQSLRCCLIVPTAIFGGL